MFGQSYLAGKGVEKLVEGITGSKGLARVCHILTSKAVAITTIDPGGHAASYADVIGNSLADSAGDSAADVVDSSSNSSKVRFGSGGCYCGYNPNTCGAASWACQWQY